VRGFAFDLVPAGERDADAVLAADAEGLHLVVREAGASDQVVKLVAGLGDADVGGRAFEGAGEDFALDADRDGRVVAPAPAQEGGEECDDVVAFEEGSADRVGERTGIPVARGLELKDGRAEARP
jgi:hypothetical protein